MGVEVEWPDQPVENLTNLGWPQRTASKLAWKLPVPDFHFVAEASTIRNQAQNYFARSTQSPPLLPCRLSPAGLSILNPLPWLDHRTAFRSLPLAVRFSTEAN